MNKDIFVKFYLSTEVHFVNIQILVTVHSQFANSTRLQGAADARQCAGRSAAPGAVRQDSSLLEGICASEIHNGKVVLTYQVNGVIKGSYLYDVIQHKRISLPNRLPLNVDELKKFKTHFWDYFGDLLPLLLIFCLKKNERWHIGCGHGLLKSFKK